METEITSKGQNGELVALRNGSAVQLPSGQFAAPSPGLDIGATERELRKAARQYAMASAVKDADGIELKMTIQTAIDYLQHGRTIWSPHTVLTADHARSWPAPEINSQTADVDGYLRSRAVFEHPEQYAPEYRKSETCYCGKVGPGWMHMAPDAMLTPSEVLFIGDCCKEN